MKKTIREVIQEKERKHQENRNIFMIGVISVIWVILTASVITIFDITK